MNFQNNCNGPYIIELDGHAYVCVQLTRNATSGAELHALDGAYMENHKKIGSILHNGALTPVFA